MPLNTITKDIGQVVGFNTAILSVTTFTNLEILLKILLLIVSIVYTLDKWYYHHKKRKDG